MATQAIKFIKKSTQPTAVKGALWFNTSNNTINLCEDGSTFKAYSGVRTASYADKVLTIVNEAGTELKLDFSDVASAAILGALRTKLDNTATALGTAESNISTLQSDLATANSNISKNTTAISTEASRADAAEKKIAQDLATEIANRGTAEAAINSAANTLKGRVDGHDTEIANLKTAVGSSTSGLVKDVATLKTTVGDANGGLVKDVDTLETKVAALETNVGTSGDIGKRLAAVETLAGQNKSAIESNDSDIADHETRIQAVENAVKDGGTLEARVDSIETLIAASGDADNVINKVSDVITWFDGVSEGKGGATLLSDVATLKGTTVPAVSAQADKGVADAATAQSGVNAINEKLGTGFSKTSTVATQLAAVKTTANAALPKATYDTYIATTATTLSNLDTAVKAAKSQADKGVTDAAAAQTTASQGVADAAAALAKANEKVASVAITGDNYITVSNASGNTDTARKMNIALDVATDIAGLTADNKQVANAKAMKDYVDNKIVASLVWDWE